MNVRKSLRGLAIGALVAVTGVSATTMATAGDASSANARWAAADLEAGCTVNAHKVETCLNDPGASNSAKRTVLIDRLVELVNHTRKGDHIRIAMYVWENDGEQVSKFTKRLIVAAEDRDVKVRILLDRKSTKQNEGTFKRLRRDIGKKRVQVCDANASNAAKRCLTDGGIQHNKLFLFDFNGDKKGGKKTVVSSINLTSAIYKRYNNMVVLRDDAKLSNFYLRYFEKMRKGSWSDWDTPGDRVGKGSGGRTLGNVFPQLHSHDTMAKILNAITKCPRGARKVSLLANKFETSRLEKGTPLRKALNGVPEKCDVRILTSGPEKGVLHKLRRTGARARQYVEDPSHHSKYVLVDAKTKDLIGGRKPAEREYVWTGSLNMTSGYKTSANSNVLVRGQQTHTVYQRQFDQLWQTTD